jgi:hypothetical protein
MNERLRRAVATFKRAWFWLFLALSIAYIAHYLSGNIAALTRLAGVGFKGLVGMILLFGLYWTVACIAWQTVVRQTVGVHLSFTEAFRHQAAVAMGKYLPGKVWGMLARATFLNQHSISFRDAAFVTIAEQFIMIHAGLILAALLLPLLLPTALGWLVTSAMIVSALIGPKLLGTAIRILPARLRGNLDVAASYSMPQYLRMTALFILTWALVSGMLVCLAFSILSTPVDHLTAAAIVISNCVATVAGFFALFAPGGIGVREAIAAYILHSQIPMAEAAFVVIAQRIALVVGELAVAAVAGMLTVKGSPASRVES